ncbi:MAG: alpha/beta hydrolase [Acidobacteriaceae bacterium]|nr:alpha/beta hydrolase [Acidobacteriaceae bacterium]MBV9779562.1 alpha/beta hydrolase [Acidobacteriaceae bacterium]
MRVLGALLATVVVLGGIGAIYQSVGYWLDSRRFPQRGRSFWVESIKLNLNCTGEGGPLVVLDSGLGGSSLDWLRVQRGIAKFTRVCSYDRAGYGWSDPSPMPRTSLQIATELRELLASAEERGPYLLVGHSFGGYNVRMFAKLYPSDVAGMVLVDAEHPDEEMRQKRLQDALPALVKKSIENNEERTKVWDRITQPIKLYLGVDRLKVALGGVYSPSFPRDFQEEILFLEQQPKYIKAVEAEDKLDDQSAAQVRAAGSLGDRPLIVLTAGIPYAGDPSDTVLTEAQKKSRDNLWISELQTQYAHLSSRGKQVVVGDSSHEMVAAVREVWGLVDLHSP